MAGRPAKVAAEKRNLRQELSVTGELNPGALFDIRQQRDAVDGQSLAVDVGDPYRAAASAAVGGDEVVVVVGAAVASRPPRRTSSSATGLRWPMTWMPHHQRLEPVLYRMEIVRDMAGLSSCQVIGIRPAAGLASLARPAG